MSSLEYLISPEHKNIEVERKFLLSKREFIKNVLPNAQKTEITQGWYDDGISSSGKPNEIRVRKKVIYKKDDPKEIESIGYSQTHKLKIKGELKVIEHEREINRNKGDKFTNKYLASVLVKEENENLATIKLKPKHFSGVESLEVFSARLGIEG